MTITQVCFPKFSETIKKFVFEGIILKCSLKAEDSEAKTKEPGTNIFFTSLRVGNGNTKLKHVFQGFLANIMSFSSVNKGLHIPSK